VIYSESTFQCLVGL